MTSEPSDVVSVADLPVAFAAKYMGVQPARGLWGIKHTRKPVDDMVKEAKALPLNASLQKVTVTVSTNGIEIKSVAKKEHTFHPINTVSYGVQDMVYTRVFSMIIVKSTDIMDIKVDGPFECHAFVCDSRNTVRRLTYALAAAFQEYSRNVREGLDSQAPSKKFAIDLRTPEEIQGNEEDETDA